MIDINPLGPWEASNSVAVTPGQRYVFWAYVAAHRCKAALVLYFLRADGTYCADGRHTTGWQTVGWGGRALEDFTQLSVFAVAPVDAVSAIFAVRKGNTEDDAPQPDSYLFIGPSMFAEALVSQTTPTAYSPGAPMGRFAALNVLDPNNVATYIANAAIGRAQIGIAAIGFANIGVAEVGTLSIDGNAVTVPAYNNGFYTAQVTIELNYPGWVVAFASFTQGSGKNAHFWDLIISGTLVAQEKPIQNTTGSLSGARFLEAGVHTISVQCQTLTGDGRCGLVVMGAKR